MITQYNISTISELRFKTKDVLKKATKELVFMFHRSTPKGVLLSMEDYQELMNALEDYYLSMKAEEYEKEDKTKIQWITHEEIKKLKEVDTKSKAIYIHEINFRGNIY